MNIFVACGSRNTNDEKIINDIKQFGKYIKEKNHTLVFGAYDKGIMGLVYDESKNDKNKPISITLEKWKENLKSFDSKEEILTEKIYERKYKLIEKSDVIVILTGGCGTIAEFFEAIDSKMIDEHKKEILLLNTNGYYDSLLDLIKNFISKGFAEESLLNSFKVFININDLINELEKISSEKL